MRALRRGLGACRSSGACTRVRGTRVAGAAAPARAAAAGAAQALASRCPPPRPAPRPSLAAAGAGAAATAAGLILAAPSPAHAEEPAGGTRVYVWGQRAAIPVSEASRDAAPDGDVRVPVEVAWFRRHAERRGCRWRQLAFGPSFGAARSSEGELFVWGSCKGREGSRAFMEPRPLAFEDSVFQDVQCSESAVWGLTVSGQVVVWERVPAAVAEQSAPTGRFLRGLDSPVRSMSVGPSHAAFITQEGEVYCLGSNRCGECGADPASQGAAAACRRVQFPRHSEPIARVRCGRSHTVAVGAEGQVLAWGDDSKIQLGLGDTRSNIGDERPWSGSRGYHNFLRGGEGMAPASAIRGGPDAPSFSRARSTSAARYGEYEAHYQWRPSQMPEIPLEFERQAHGIPYPPPDALECGDDFTVLLVRDSPDWFAPEEESHRLFCCGENGRGQCGRSLQASQQTLAATRLPKNSYTLGLSCGSSHCLAVLRRVGARKRELWSWGSNAKGQAGAASSGVVCPAVRVKLPRDARLEAAWCGFATSAAICSERPSSSGTSGDAGEASEASEAAAPAAAPEPAKPAAAPERTE